MLYFIFAATKVRKTYEKRIRNLHFFSHKPCKRLHIPHSVETIN